MKAKVFIAPGVAEGRWHIARLGLSLERHHFEVTDHITKADIIIAHSGGLHVVPKHARKLIHESHPKLMVWIGLPYWPGKPALLSLMQLPVKELAISIRSRTVLLLCKKTFWNLLYFMGEPLYVWKVALSMRRTPPAQLLSAPHNVVIRNHDDVWCTPQIKRYVGNAEVIDLPGSHDDCWYRPDYYVKLLMDQLDNY